MNAFKQKYIDLSKRVRATEFKDVEVLGQFFVLKEELEKSVRTLEEEMILINIYSLLEFHLSAFSLFKQCADLNQLKNKARLVVLEGIAMSHQNTFARKDPRVVKPKLLALAIDADDLVALEQENTYNLNGRCVVLFDKEVSGERVTIRVEKESLNPEDWVRLNGFLMKLVRFDSELIEFYNSEFYDDLGLKADSLWFEQLEVYSVNLMIGGQGDCYVSITVGDTNFEDHLLDIEVGECGIESMCYDG